VVVTGTGGIGVAAARRIGSGRTIVLADASERALGAAADALRGAGHHVVACPTDVSDPAAVAALAATAAQLGEVSVLVHTAGIAPEQGTVAQILAVDLLGTALVLDAFASVIAAGGAGVAISSIAGHMVPVDPELERLLAATPTARLLELPGLDPAGIADTNSAYGNAKRANRLRARMAAGTSWRARGARLNTISPGIIATPMTEHAFAGPAGGQMRAMVAGSAAGRAGTPEEIAAAVAFLVGPEASFINGADLLVDGGLLAGLAGATAA
jgi:NAD(P)-dependent dehydrogenase (short-subunit alcohol dehydrogenase family)